MRKSIGVSESSSIFMLGVCASSILSLFAGLILRRTDGYFDGMSIANWVSYAIMQGGFLLTVILYPIIRRMDEVHIARIHRPRSPWQLLLTPFIAIATILIFLPLANAWSSFLDIIHFHGGGVAMPHCENVGRYFLALFVLCVLPAFGEELLLRGNTFHGLSTRNVWFGILMSALFFSLMHANPMQTVHQFGLGVVLALVFVLTDSIWPCVLIHFFNNFISVTVTAYIPKVNQIYIDLGYFNWLTGAASVLVGLFLLIVLLYVLYRMGGGGGQTFRVIGNSIEYDDFSIYAIDENANSNPNGVSAKTACRFCGAQVRDFFKFFGSLFTKDGWRRLTRTLSSQNEVQYIGKAQPMIGFWIALGLITVYWLYAFISGLV